MNRIKFFLLEIHSRITVKIFQNKLKSVFINFSFDINLIYINTIEKLPVKRTDG